MFVKFADTPKVLAMCETRLRDYNLSGIHKFVLIMIVFYTGYSEGEVFLMLPEGYKYACSSYYIDWDVLEYSDQLTIYEVKPDPHVTCWVDSDSSHTANISMPSLCEKTTFMQMAVELRQSKCNHMFIDKIRSYRLHYEGFKYTLQLEKACTNTYIHIFLSIFKQILYTSAIGQAGSGFLIKYIYEKNCPRECSKYHYVVKVLREREQTVYEYTSPFGQGIYTGFHNQGFKTTVIPPAKKLPFYCGSCRFLFNAVTIRYFPEDNKFTFGNHIYHLYNTR